MLWFCARVVVRDVEWCPGEYRPWTTTTTTSNNNGPSIWLKAWWAVSWTREWVATWTRALFVPLKGSWPKHSTWLKMVCQSVEHEGIVENFVNNLNFSPLFSKQKWIVQLLVFCKHRAKLNRECRKGNRENTSSFVLIFFSFYFEPLDGSTNLVDFVLVAKINFRFLFFLKTTIAFVVF